MKKDFLHIGYSKLRNDYFLWDYRQELICCKCLKPLEVKFVLNTFLHRGLRDFVQKLYCADCFRNMSLDSKYDGTLTLVHIESLPLDSIPVLPQVLIPESGGLAHGFGQVLSDDDIKKLDMTKVVNHCKHALNPSQSLMEGSEPELVAERVKEKVKALDKPLSAIEGLDVLESLGSAKAYSWAEQDKEEELLEEARRLDEVKNGRRLIT